MTTDLSVIVVTYNSKVEIRSFVESLSRQVDLHSLRLEIVIVDNGSTDGTEETLQETQMKFRALNPRVIINQENIGLSRALNYGIELSRGDTLLLCNPDIRFGDSLVELIRTSTEFPNFVIFPELVGPDGELQRAVYMRLPTRSRVFMTHTTIGGAISRFFFPQIRDDYHYRNHRFRSPLDSIEQGAPVCMVIRRPLVAKLSPLFDSQFPVFWNDVDLSMKARRLGVRFAIAPDIKILHQLGHSIKKLGDERKLMLFYSNAGLVGFLRKWKLNPRFFQTVLFFDSVYMTALGLFTVMTHKSSRRQGLKITTSFWISRFRCSLK